MRLSVFAIAFAAIAILSSPAPAAVVFYLDMDTTELAPGIQSIRESKPGDFFDIDIWMEIETGTNNVESFAMTFEFKPTYVTVSNPRTPNLSPEFPGRPTGFEQTTPPSIYTDVNSDLGTVGTFAGDVAGRPAYHQGTKFIVGRLSLTINQVDLPVDTVESEIQLLGLSATVDEGNTSVSFQNISLETLSISAVPEPSAWALCLVTSAAFSLRRRRRAFSPAS